MLTLQELSKIYPNEQLFLILLTRYNFATITAGEVELFVKQNDIDWTKFYLIARTHSIRPFVYHCINTGNFSVPAAVKDKLHNDYKIALFNNVGLSVSASKIVTDLKRLNVEVIPYKGPGVAANYMGNIALRECADIDFIIDKKDAATIEDYLVNMGYKAKQTVPRPYLGYLKFFFKDMVYTSANGSVTIELHWALLDRFSGKFPNFSYFAGNTEPYGIGTLQLTKLKPVSDLVALISNHFVKDLFIKFKYLIDIAGILQQYPHLAQHPEVLNLAKQYHFEKKLAHGLSLIEQIIGIGQKNFQPTVVNKQHLLLPLQYPISLSRFQFNEISFIKMALRLKDNSTEKIKFLAKSFGYFFIPSYMDINAFKLPIYLSPILFILRPIRLLFFKFYQ